MNIKLQLAACISIAALSGCTSVEEHNKNILDMAKISCINYGFVASTQSYLTCVQREVNAVKQTEAIKAIANR